MAATAYFEKAFEDDTRVTYRYGTEPEDLSLELTIDKAAREPVDPPARPGVTVRLAFGRIIRMFRESGTWPDRGASFT